MTKRKNPLKDLDSFLQQEASSIIEPKKVAPAEKHEVRASTSVSKEEILLYFQKLADEDEQTFKTVLLDVIQKSLEFHGIKRSTDKMLMNTLLYLQNQDNWKEAIAEYWSVK
ncbi:MAG: hypothetical protein AAF519_10490 [Bacteroidota bacterium]